MCEQCSITDKAGGHKTRSHQIGMCCVFPAATTTNQRNVVDAICMINMHKSMCQSIGQWYFCRLTIWSPVQVTVREVSHGDCEVVLLHFPLIICLKTVLFFSLKLAI